MLSVSIKLPPQLNLETGLKMYKSISTVDESRKYLIDFGTLQFAQPFGMLLLAEAIKNLRAKFPSARLTCQLAPFTDALSYASHMGLITACGFEHGNKPSHGARSYSSYLKSYIPITYVHCKQLSNRDAIEDHALELARQLIRQTHGSLVDIFTYSFREIIRNCVEHSRSERIAYCAQYWPSNHTAELAIIDTGIGIRESLSENPFLSDRLTSDREALKLALLPGVSGKRFEGVRATNDVWQNSGYGLYINKCISTEGGSFFICSGDAGIMSTSSDALIDHHTLFRGTAICININTRLINNAEALIKMYTERGEKIALSIKGAVPNASAMSKMLKNNYRVDLGIEVGDTVRHAKFGKGVISEKVFSPQGEMIWVNFSGGRRKKVLSKDVVQVDDNVDDE